jgi:hypothetical protein
MPPKRCEADVDRLQGALKILNGRPAEVRNAMKYKKQQAKAQANKAGMMRAARVIMCLPQGGLDLAVPFLTCRSELDTEQRAAQQASLENWFVIAVEDDKQQWCTHPPSTRGTDALREVEVSG